MQRRCDQCGKPYEAKRATSKYCSSGCRARASTGSRPVVRPIPAISDTTGLVSATQAQLERAKQLDTVLGQQALALAGRIASQHETGAAVAALSREFRAVMDAALADVAVVNPLDELRERRERKRNAG